MLSNINFRPSKFNDNLEDFSVKIKDVNLSLTNSINLSTKTKLKKDSKIVEIINKMKEKINIILNIFFLYDLDK